VPARAISKNRGRSVTQGEEKNNGGITEKTTAECGEGGGLGADRRTLKGEEAEAEWKLVPRKPQRGRRAMTAKNSRHWRGDVRRLARGKIRRRGVESKIMGWRR